MTAPKLSVLVTVCNGGAYLPQAIESILSQTFDDFELLIIDDGSNDDTWDTLTAYASKDGRIALLRNERNLGITRSMNRLFGLAKGDYIVRHDADDISLPDRFARQVTFLDSHAEIGVVGAWIAIIGEDGGRLDLDRPSCFPLETTNEAIQQQLLTGNCLGQGAVMFRRECLSVAGFYDEDLDYTEDYDLWLRLAEVTQVAKLPIFLYQYRQHSASVSQVHHSLQMLHQAQTLEKAIIRRHGPSAPESYFVQTARHYLTAASAYQLQGDEERASHCLARALILSPLLFEAEHVATPIQTTEAGLRLAADVFAQVPRTWRFARLRSRLLSRLYMREVFAGVEQSDTGRIDANLWAALWYDPGWILNFGVMSIVTRAVGRQVRDMCRAESMRWLRNRLRNLRNGRAN